MVGMCRRTGRPLDGWNHVVQSMDDILTTAVGERVERRRYGAGADGLLDRPMTPQSLMDVYVTVVRALAPRTINGHQYGEPRFDLVRMVPRAAGPDGAMMLELVGLYYPRGHLGDFTVFETAHHEVTR
ncbi:GPW/gp25 family protein [Roseospira goensis]|uniref:Uncharacterized protein n=1 Tax=Roseospira goensis TaxID=391922 RepID=A0A7W6S2R6_9PROT|nr:baseplate assembly protein [Roseospira goensis]MBB4287666.1 hypothetical protein [Roseospira goensis]